MKRDKLELEDELRSEYNLRELKVRKFGPERKSFGKQTIQLESDVAKVFPDSVSVNEALRFLIRITRENKSLLSNASKDTSSGISTSL